MRFFNLFVGIILLFSSCGDENSSVPPNIEIIRFDKDVASFDTSQFEASEKKIIAKHGDIYQFYIERLMGLGSLDKNSSYYYKPHFNRFLSEEYPAMMDSFERYVFKDIDDVEQDLMGYYSNLFKEFPEKKPTTIYSFFVSPMGTNPQAAFSYGEDTIGINWFNYLGKDFSLYGPLYEGYAYMIEWNQLDYISRNVMLVEYSLLSQKYPSKEVYTELIYNMIEKGKQYYFLDIICPEMKNRVKIGYTEDQLNWCRDNEFEIWAFFKEHKLLYSTETMEIKRMIDEGPTTPGMPAESPGMVGTWLGWQIVKSYMNNENYSLKELLETSPKQIMKKSKYKPKK